MKRTIVFLALLSLTACNGLTIPDEYRNQGQDTDETEKMMIEDSDPSNDNDDMVNDSGSMIQNNTMMEDGSAPENSGMKQGAVYTDYSAAALTDGEPKVLFFYAAWCPVCRNADAQMLTWFSQGSPALSVYKVNYDTETELKARYGVTYQHTYVLVDGQGNAVQTVQGPSDDMLRALVGA